MPPPFMCLNAIALCNVFLMVGLLGGQRVTGAEDARPQIPPEIQDQFLAQRLAAAVRVYVIEHDGRSPSAWAHLKIEADPFSSKPVAPPIEDRYVFVKKRVILPAAKPEDERMVVMVGNSPIRALGRNTKGRYVILKNRAGDVTAQWMTETEADRLLNPGAPSEAVAAAQKPQINLALEITNPNATLLPGEPLCIFAPASAKEAEIPDMPRFSFEVNGPGGKRVMELIDFNFLYGGLMNSPRPSQIRFRTKAQGELAADFHAALLLPIDTQGGKKVQIARDIQTLSVLTSEPGEYEIKIKEDSSGCESPPARFKVVAGTKEDADAAVMFISHDGLELFLRPEDDLAVYEELLKKYPNSRHAAYAALIVVQTKFEQLYMPPAEATEKEAVEWAGKHARAILALAPYLDRTLALKFASLFDAKAMYLKGKCLVFEGKLDEARQLFDAMIKKYDGVACLGELNLAKKEMTELDTNRKDVDAMRKKLGLP